MQGLRTRQNPDIVISHSGWGCGLEVSLVFQKLNELVT